MSMREYPIMGYGIEISNISWNVEDVGMSFFEKILSGSCVEFISNEYTSYIMISAGMPWQVRNDEPSTKKECNKYFYNILKEYINGTEEEFNSRMEYISDTYFC